MNRIGLKTLIFLAFIVLLGVMAYTNYLGINSLGSANTRLDSLINNSAEQVKLASMIRQDLLSVSRAQKNTILATEEQLMEGLEVIDHAF